MSGICLLLHLQLPNLDLIHTMIDYYHSFEDSNTNTEGIICNDDIDTEILKANDFVSYIKLLQQRGPDYISINTMNIQNNDIVLNVLDNTNLISYYDYFNYTINTNSAILITTQLYINNSNVCQPITDHRHNILQFDGRIYTINDNSKADVLYLYDILSDISNEHISENEYSNTLFKVLNNIESDHSFIFYDNNNKRIVINRDIFGKKSLILIYIKSLNILMLTPFVPPLIYNLRKHNNDIYIVEVPSNAILIIDIINNKLSLYHNTILPSDLRFNDILPALSISEESIIMELNNVFINVYKKRLNISNISNISNDSVAILFSGGIDSLLMAYYITLVTADSTTIDLLNISFNKENAPDRSSGIISYTELIQKFPNKKINLILIDKDYTADIESTDYEHNILYLLYPRESHMDFNISTALKFCCSKTGMLVNKQKLLQYTHSNGSFINAKLNEADKNNYNNNILSKQIKPINYAEFIEDWYTSESKVVFSGLGADEFFGGYSRYQNGDLAENMKKDINRIWMRNFGRDDRMCSDNGISLCYPYFDYDLLKLLSQIKNTDIVSNFKLKQRGVGEKILLRRLGKYVGLERCAAFEKRAIQFGTKLAHITNIKKYGTNSKANGKAQFK